MDLFNVLTLVGGLSLFLFGTNLMGEVLEKRAGSSLKSMLGKLTTNKRAGLLTGLGVTAIIQSSSATTVMDLHEYLEDVRKRDPHYNDMLKVYEQKYSLINQIQTETAHVI